MVFPFAKHSVFCEKKNLDLAVSETNFVTMGLIANEGHEPFGFQYDLDNSRIPEFKERLQHEGAQLFVLEHQNSQGWFKIRFKP